MKKEEYAAQSLAALKELAKSRKMRGTSTMKKGDLIEALAAFDAEHAADTENAEAAAEKPKMEERRPRVTTDAENVGADAEKPKAENRRPRVASDMEKAGEKPKLEGRRPRVASDAEKVREVAAEKQKAEGQRPRMAASGIPENTQETENGNGRSEAFPGQGTRMRTYRTNRPISASVASEGQSENRETEKRNENYTTRNTTGTARREVNAGESTRNGMRFRDRRNEADGMRRQEYSGTQEGRRERTGMNRIVRRDNMQSQNYRRDNQESNAAGYNNRFSYRNNNNNSNTNIENSQRNFSGESTENTEGTSYRTQNAGADNRVNNADSYRSQSARSDASGTDLYRNTAVSASQELRGDDRPSQDLSSLDSGQEACGILEVMSEGFGFIRSDNFMSGDNDVYVSPSQIRRFGLRTGDIISGNTRIKTMQEKYSALLYLKTINGMTPSEAMKRCKFEDMTPVFPNERLSMERGSSGIAMRIVDLFSPIGKGQRGMIVSPPKAGKTTLLKDVAHSILENDPNMQLIILLIDERPEEVTDIKEAICGENVEVIYSTFDEQPEHHKRVSEMVIERAKRLVEQKMDVTILLDSITRLARAYNLTVPPSGRTLSGGLDPAALYMPKRFFGAARNMREGGSLTILATALVDTGSKMDDVVYEEFKGTGNMELVLDRKLSERRVFPAIDIPKSGTRREDLLLDKEEQEAVYIMRRALNGMKSEDAVENILNMFVHTKTNRELVAQVRRQRFV